jgi:hypothetical protein
MTSSLRNPETAAFLIALVACTGSLISTLEWLANRRQLQPGGLFSWSVVSSRQGILATGLGRRLVGGVLQYRPFCAVLLIRTFALAALPALVWLGTRVSIVACLCVIVGTALLMSLRSPFGMDGSDQMAVQVFGALLLGYSAGSTLSLQIAIWYIAIQAALSYFVSGIAKALSPVWRRGDGTVFRIFNTRTYGYEPVARALLHRPRLMKLVDWSAFTIEMLFPVGIVVGLPAVILFLVWGVTFHAMNALVMGLNSFFWAFVATYPAVWYVALQHPHGFW